MMNGFTARGFQPYRPYVVEKAATGSSGYRPESILLYSHPEWTLHRILD